MGFNALRYLEFLEICSKFPLAPIEDDNSYRTAIEILDQLFARDVRTPVESEYFRTLAEMASEYEMTVFHDWPRGKANDHGRADRSGLAGGR